MSETVDPVAALAGIDRSLDIDGRAWWRAEIAVAVSEWLTAHGVAVTDP